MSEVLEMSPTLDRGKAEFDSYAQGYAAGMDNPAKRLLGDSADDFIAVKLHWLLRTFPGLRSAGPAYRVLDYGCGTGTLLRLMREAGLHAGLAGCDISGEMLEEGARCWPAHLPRPELLPQDGAAVPFGDGNFDLVIISAVLHHVPLADREAVFAALRHSLRPNGQVVVFEHNPLNPVTRYVVAHTLIDQNAILLRARETQERLQWAQFENVRTSYLMFFPPRMRSLAACEAMLGWLPLGAQYVTTALRP